MVRIIKVDEVDGLPVFVAQEESTGEQILAKNWFEKSKNKWHIVLGPNSANRKYIAHNEFYAKAKEDEAGNLVYIVSDKTSGPRTIGTAQPDKKLVPFMTDEEKADYEAIIARAIERRNAEKEANKSVPLTDEEKLAKRIAALQAKLAKLQEDN